MKKQVASIFSPESNNPHSHVSGLGTTGGLPYSGDGLVSQERAREALGLIKSLILKGKANGILAFLYGPHDTGKSALLYGLAKEIEKENHRYVQKRIKNTIEGTDESGIISNNDTHTDMDTNGQSRVIFSSNGVKFPVNFISGPEIQSTDFLIQKFRECVTVRIVEKSVVIEGEVVDLHLGSIRKLTLKTTEMESIFEIGEKMAIELEKQKINAGDVIRIKKNTGEIIKLGSTRSSETNFIFNVIPCPEGELMNLVEDERLITLHDLDTANLSDFKTQEVDYAVRNGVNVKVEDWIAEGICTIIPGLLIIDNGEYLTNENIEMIYNFCDDPLSPAVIICMSDENYKKFRKNSKNFGRIGDRTLRIITKGYSQSDACEIIRIRAGEEEINLDENVIEKLAEMGLAKGFHYVFNIMKFMAFNSENTGRKIDLPCLTELMNLLESRLNG